MVFLEEVTAEQDGGKSYDDLTREDYAQYSAEVRKAVRSELQTWSDHKCFDVIPREGARNVLDVRRVGEWKKLKHPTDPNKMVWGIRMRMTQRGFKDIDAEALQVFSGTSSRLSQRIVVSVCVL